MNGERTTGGTRGAAVLVDVGNTSVKLARTDAHGPGPSASVPSAGLTAGMLEDAARVLPGGDERADAVVVSSVVPRLDPVVARFAQTLGARLLSVPLDLPVPLKNRYARPEEVGADRLVGAFAARRLYPEAGRIVVVDFGTATTFDCVDGDAYLGGLICPGVLSSTRSLSEETAKLPLATLEIDPAGLRLGRSTLDSLNQGLVYGFAAMVEGLCARIEGVLGGEAKVIATGGFAQRIGGVCPAIEAVHPDLLMRGLFELWRTGPGRAGK